MSIKTKSVSDTCYLDSDYVQEDSGYYSIKDGAPMKVRYQRNEEFATSSPSPAQDTTQFVSEPTGEHITVTPTRIQYNPKKQRLYKKYDLGNVTYNIPDTMTVFSNYVIRVRINKLTSLADIHANLGPGRVVDTIIKISDKMEVTIKDESTGEDRYFEISKVNDDEQYIDDDEYTEWVFNVRPVKFGNKRLNIVISMIKNGSKKEVVYTDTVFIKMSVKNQVLTFWQKYWQWSFTTIIIPVFLYFWRRRKKESQ